MAELTINQALQKAIDAHKAGQVQEADRLYEAILKIQPKHPDANHNMGVLAVSVGKFQEALQFFKTALEANPNSAQFWFSYIDILIKLEQLTDAKVVLGQAKSKGAKGVSFDKLEKRLQDAQAEPFATSNIGSEEKKEQANVLDNLKLDQAIKLAKKKAKNGVPDQAKHIYQDILKKFPNNKRARSGMKALAVRPVGQSSKVKDPSQDQLQLLSNLYSQGQLPQALRQIKSLVQKFPKSPVLFNIQGAVLKGLGQLDLSVEAYNKAIALRPDIPEAYYNMGNALLDQDKYEDAIEAYNRALAIKPDYADAHNNMGNALKEQEKLEEAIEAYKRALAIKPDYAVAYNNMGNALQDQGKHEQAIEVYNKALAVKPNYAGAYNNMGNALKGIKFNRPIPGLEKTIGSLLDQKTFVRPKSIAPAVISLLKFEANLQKHLIKSAVVEIEQALQQTVIELSDLPLLLTLMSICPLADLGLEALLRKIRARILLTLLSFESTSETLQFQSALALQCFTNEYIYDCSEEEEKAVEALEASVEAVLSKGEQPSSKDILCLASYKALHEYQWCNLITDSSEIHHVFIRQIREPKLEIDLKSSVPILEEITNEVSVKVRSQYEDNPYPRWVNLGLPLNPKPITKVVSQSKIKLFDKAICEVGEPDILVAGCGTGQHSIGTAATFKNSNVLAIDLSLSSLAYAKRKTEELSITNINYMQADILKLQKLDRQFDIIESAGVLHHMNNPMAGWQVLVDCLRDGGLMKIGLYSELARQSIVEMRQEISQSGIGSSDVEMKSFRSHSIASGEAQHKLVHSWADFYSLSELRDLLFHVQEHRFTIPQLKQCLDELGLRFCGFENESIVKKFRVSSACENDPYDLDKWQIYEESNSKTFVGMYQFWCQKVA